MKKKINISDQTLKLITQKQIKPIPKWEFIAKNISLWTGLFISLIILILGFGLSTFGLLDNIIIPYLWLFLTVLFFGLSYLLFTKTKNAYHFTKSQIFLFITMVGLIFGSLLFKIGIASRFDKNLGQRSDLYRQMVPMRLRAWSQPQNGYLSGTINTNDNNSVFTLTDFSGKLWQINFENAIIRGRVNLSINSQIKLIGSQSGNDSFVADEIRPWNGMGQNMMQENY